MSLYNDRPTTTEITIFLANRRIPQLQILIRNKCNAIFAIFLLFSEQEIEREREKKNIGKDIFVKIYTFVVRFLTAEKFTMKVMQMEKVRRDFVTYTHFLVIMLTEAWSHLNIDEIKETFREKCTKKIPKKKTSIYKMICNWDTQKALNVPHFHINVITDHFMHVDELWKWTLLNSFTSIKRHPHHCHLMLCVSFIKPFFRDCSSPKNLPWCLSLTNNTKQKKELIGIESNLYLWKYLNA